MTHIIPFEEVYIGEDVNLLQSSYQNAANRLKILPTGFVIQDAYNNLTTPVKIPKIDGPKLDYPKFIQQFQVLYYNRVDVILPWHYVIELYQKNYIIYNTRPINLKYPYTTQQVKDDPQSPILNEFTKQFLDSTNQLNTMIHVLIIGDSSVDVYTKFIYKNLDWFLIDPVSRSGRFSPTLYNNIIPLNLGKRFKPNNLLSYLP
jgi:hypothetical protein